MAEWLKRWSTDPRVAGSNPTFWHPWFPGSWGIFLSSFENSKSVRYPSPESNSSETHKTSHDHKWRLHVVVVRDDCWNPPGNFRSYCSCKLWNMSDFICLERHLEASGTLVESSRLIHDYWRFDLWKVDDLALFWSCRRELSWTRITTGRRFAELNEDLNVWLCIYKL